MQHDWSWLGASFLLDGICSAAQSDLSTLTNQFIIAQRIFNHKERLKFSHTRNYLIIGLCSNLPTIGAGSETSEFGSTWTFLATSMICVESMLNGLWLQIYKVEMKYSTMF